MKDMYKKLSLYHFADDVKKYRVNNKLNCVIFGNFGAMNTGDEAILAGQLRELQRAKPTSVIVVARFPEAVKKLHKVDAVSLFSVPTLVKTVWNADVIIVGGGGIISKVERGIIGFVYQLYMLFSFFGLPLLLAKPTFALGIGVYDNANPFNLAIASFLLRRIKKVTVRDFHSFELLISKNVPVALKKDNSFLLDLPNKQTLIKDSFFTKFYNSKRKQIGISLLSPESEQEKKKLTNEIVQFIRLNYQTADFWFYSLDHHTSYTNDKAFGQYLKSVIKKQIGNGVFFHFIPETWTPEKVFGSFQLLDFMITQRLHGAIFSYRLGINFAGISYDKKCTSFLHSVGKDVFRADTVTGEQLLAAYRREPVIEKKELKTSPANAADAALAISIL